MKLKGIMKTLFVCAFILGSCMLHAAQEDPVARQALLAAKADALTTTITTTSQSLTSQMNQFDAALQGFSNSVQNLANKLTVTAPAPSTMVPAPMQPVAIGQPEPVSAPAVTKDAGMPAKKKVIKRVVRSKTAPASSAKAADVAATTEGSNIPASSKAATRRTVVKKTAPTGTTKSAVPVRKRGTTTRK